MRENCGDRARRTWAVELFEGARIGGAGGAFELGGLWWLGARAKSRSGAGCVVHRLSKSKWTNSEIHDRRIAERTSKLKSFNEGPGTLGCCQAVQALEGGNQNIANENAEIAEVAEDDVEDGGNGGVEDDGIEEEDTGVGIIGIVSIINEMSSRGGAASGAATSGGAPAR